MTGIRFTGNNPTWSDQVIDIGGRSASWVEKFWKEQVVTAQEEIIKKESAEMEAKAVKYGLIGLGILALIMIVTRR